MRYERPPLVEVLCEFQFTPESSWDRTVPDLIYDRVRDEFPVRKSVRALSISIVTSIEGVQQHLEPSERAQFWRQDESALVQVGPRLLAVNHLRPYDTWVTSARPLASKALAAYLASAPGESLSSARVRYINIVDIVAPVVLDEFFNYAPRTPPQWEALDGFLCVSEMALEAGRDRLRVTTASRPMANPSRAGIVLDLDYWCTAPGVIAARDAMDWADMAHQRLNAAFRDCITEKLEARFGMIP